MLQRTTSADRGLVEVPLLTPHLESRRIDDEVLLVSETFNTMLKGRIPCKLIPLCDGRRTHTEIVDSLSPAHPASEIRAAITSLASRGYLVSGDFRMAPGRAACWSSLGASPRWAEQRLQEAAVTVSGDDGTLTRRLDALGVRKSSSSPSISVVVCADYLAERHDAINRSHLETGTPWMLLRPGGMRPLFGPVLRPAEGGPCWACLAYRLGAHQEVHNFLRNLGGEAAAVQPRALEPVMRETVCGLAAAEIAKWLVLGESAPIHTDAISLNTATVESQRHLAMRRPQCFACGDEVLYRADRPAEPVRLQPSPQPVHTSGGRRAAPPEVTLAKYRHLVSPVTGVVAWLARMTEDTDPWLNVHWAGDNHALRSRHLSSLRRSLRSKSAGKGTTPLQSEASALCEAIERYSGAFHGDEIRSRRSLADFEKGGGSDAIHPNDVQLFSDRQLDEAARTGADSHPYNFVPVRFDPEAEIDWSPVWSLTHRRHRYIPTSILYGMATEDGSGLKADSNGCAAGNTLEEAILQAFLEIAERDAFAIWWYNRLCLPEVDLSSFDDEFLASAQAYYARCEREMWVLDVTGDFGIPVFVAVSRRTGSDTEEIIYAAGAHTDPHIAALRAVCELNQCLQTVTASARHGPSYAVNDPTIRSWWQTGRLADHRWLSPASGAAQRWAPDYRCPETSDTREDVEHCRALVEARGMEFLVLDQTRPDIGMPVARVVVPGMRHFWPRLAPGRLFDVPVEMGWLQSPLSEDQLNPVPVIV